MKTTENDLQVLNLLSDDDRCSRVLKDVRLTQEFSCKSCGASSHYWLPSKGAFQCKTFRFRTSLKSGTILQGSKLPLSYWFKTVYFISRYPHLSAYELQKLLGHKFYEPILLIMRKVKPLFLNSGSKTLSHNSPGQLIEGIGRLLAIGNTHS